MKTRDYGPLIADMAEAYGQHSPRSKAINDSAKKVQVDGGSHTLRLLEPFPPRVVAARGAHVTDEDGHQILDFWQGHMANILGHNPGFVTATLARALEEGVGLQTGFTDRLQAEVAQILCDRTSAERVRFTTSGTLATMYTIILARAFTGRDLVGGLVGLAFFYLTFEFAIVSSIPLMTEVLPAARATLMASWIASISGGRALGALVASGLYESTLAPGIVAIIVAVIAFRYYCP